MSFEEGNWPRSMGESIVLTCDRDKVFQNSFFHSLDSQKKTETGTFATSYDDISIPYHEMGHSSSADFFRFTSAFGIDDTIKLIAALSNNLTFNENALNAFFEHLKTAPAEMNVLFINSLSDFALATELGQPIRADHSSFALNPEKQEYDFLLPNIPFVNHSLNLNLYGAMLKIYGSSMQKYVLSMMYRDKLVQTLKAEWTLGKNIILKNLLYNKLLQDHKLQ